MMEDKEMTDLVVQSIDTLSLMDFQPIPYDLLRSRCVEMTSGLTAYAWRDWPEGLQALIHPDDLMRFDEVDLLRFIAMILAFTGKDREAFVRACDGQALRGALVALALLRSAA